MSIEKKQKVKGLTCITQLYDTDATYTVSSPGPIINDKTKFNNTDLFAKSAWYRRIQAGGTHVLHIPFGPERKYDFQKLYNTPMSDILQGGTAVNGFPGIMNNWSRFVFWNKKRNDYGIWDVGPDDKFGDIFESDNYTFTIRSLTTQPTEDHIAKARSANIIDDNNCVHGFFQKAMVNSPLEIISTNPNRDFCISFYPVDGEGYNALGNWHSFIKVKRADQNLQIARRGIGRNFMIPLQDISGTVHNKYDGAHGAQTGTYLFEAGKIYTLSNNTIELEPAATGLVLQIHQINTQ